MTVTAYYDYGGAGSVQDWSCGTQSYDGHRGTDFGTYGSWAAVDEGREVLAAAPGEVIAAHDGEFDRCTTGSCAGGGGFGNYVAIRHADGKVTYYGHMRRGSVAVSVGERVECGRRVGYIASSGYSTGPHLHFEPRIGGTSADDPFGGGGCSGPLSYWVEQGAYRALPAMRCEGPTCPEGSSPIWTCADDTRRTRCEAGTATSEECPWGCVRMPSGTDDVCGGPPDADGDGSTADADCDDADPRRTPGRAETCDGVDESCDGAIDEGLDCTPDAGAPTPDAAMPIIPTSDAGSTSRDAGTGGDAARAAALSGGCSLSRARSSDASLVVIALLALVFRRRRA